MDNSHQRVNGSASIPQKTSVPSRYHQFMTSEDEAQSSSAQSSEEEEKDEVKEDERPKETSITSDLPASPLMNSQTKQVLLFAFLFLCCCSSFLLECL